MNRHHRFPRFLFQTFLIQLLELYEKPSSVILGLTSILLHSQLFRIMKLSNTYGNGENITTGNIFCSIKYQENFLPLLCHRRCWVKQAFEQRGTRKHGRALIILYWKLAFGVGKFRSIDFVKLSEWGSFFDDNSPNRPKQFRFYTMQTRRPFTPSTLQLD